MVFGRGSEFRFLGRIRLYTPRRGFPRAKLGQVRRGKPERGTRLLFPTSSGETGEMPAISRYTVGTGGGAPAAATVRTNRRDGRAVEGARLESVYRGNSIEGSNPSLSARLFSFKLLRAVCVSLVIGRSGERTRLSALTVRQTTPPGTLMAETSCYYDALTCLAATLSNSGNITLILYLLGYCFGALLSVARVTSKPKGSLFHSAVSTSFGTHDRTSRPLRPCAVRLRLQDSRQPSQAHGPHIW